MTKRAALIGIAALTLLNMAASAPSQSPSPEHVITMRSMSYGRIPAGIKAGDTIVWVNRDNVPHSVTARNRSFNFVVPQGRSLRVTVRQIGTFAFYCTYHPAMRGTITFAAR